MGGRKGGGGGGGGGGGRWRWDWVCLLGDTSCSHFINCSPYARAHTHTDTLKAPCWSPRRPVGLPLLLYLLIVLLFSLPFSLSKFVSCLGGSTPWWRARALSRSPCRTSAPRPAQARGTWLVARSKNITPFLFLFFWGGEVLSRVKTCSAPLVVRRVKYCTWCTFVSDADWGLQSDACNPMLCPFPVRAPGVQPVWKVGRCAA